MTCRCDGIPADPLGFSLPTARGTLATDGAGYSYRETRESQERMSVQPLRFGLILDASICFLSPPVPPPFPSSLPCLLSSSTLSLSLYTSFLPSHPPCLTFINSLLCARLCAVQQGTEMKSAASLPGKDPGELLYSPRFPPPSSGNIISYI